MNKSGYDMCLGAYDDLLLTSAHTLLAASVTAEWIIWSTDIGAYRLTDVYLLRAGCGALALNESEGRFSARLVRALRKRRAAIP
jgi:hypothetical protein